VIVEVNNPARQGKWDAGKQATPGLAPESRRQLPLGLIQASILRASVDNTADNERENGGKRPDFVVRIGEVVFAQDNQIRVLVRLQRAHFSFARHHRVNTRRRCDGLDLR
jgi:hypothetical protein